jgi:DNA-binding MarR family transcriptional regulator
MSDDRPPHDHDHDPHHDHGVDDVALPALMRAARRTYGAAIREAVTEVGCDDIPRNGAFVLGAVARGGVPLGAIIDALGVSKQAGGALIDTLVNRGYLHRDVDPDDRRRLLVDLTERGEAAAAVIRQAIEDVDEQLGERVGADYVAHTRVALGALADLGAREPTP